MNAKRAAASPSPPPPPPPRVEHPSTLERSQHFRPPGSTTTTRALAPENRSQIMVNVPLQHNTQEERRTQT